MQLQEHRTRGVFFERGGRREHAADVPARGRGVRDHEHHLVAGQLEASLDAHVARFDVARAPVGAHGLELVVRRGCEKLFRVDAA